MDITTASGTTTGTQASTLQPECNCPEVCTHDHENE